MNLQLLFSKGLNPDPVSINRDFPYTTIYTFSSKCSELVKHELEISIHADPCNNRKIYIYETAPERTYVGLIDLAKEKISFSLNEKHRKREDLYVCLPTLKAVKRALYPVLKKIIVTKPRNSPGYQFQMECLNQYLN